jgi:uncharacterized membrane protein
MGSGMSFLVAYIGALVLFVAMDAVWLSTVGAALYRSTLGDLLASSIRLAPAIVFYLAYPVGIVVFAVAPALRLESGIQALALGALFGALAYATYDLTNYATLRVWSLQITILDIVYGALASGVTAMLVYFLVRAVATWFGAATP